jgi:DNA repair exonuclease SbcCD nuclease subunit
MGNAVRDGRNLRELDIENAWLACCEWASEQQPDLVVIAGDLFDSAHPTPAALQAALDGLGMMRAAGLKVLTIGGNHDTTILPGRLGPLQLVAQATSTHLVEENQMRVQLADLEICCLPYRAITSQQLSPKAAAGTQLLVAHASCDAPGLPAFAAWDHTRLSVNWLETSTLSCLGHLHVHQQAGPCGWYSGAPERLTWGEINNEPSVYWHTLHSDGRTQTRSVTIKELSAGASPRPAFHITVDVEGLQGEEALQAAQAQLQAQPLEDALVRLSLQNCGPALGSLDAKRQLENIARRAGALLSRVELSARPAEQQQTITATSLPAGGSGLAGNFRQFAQQQGASDGIAALGAALIERHTKSEA